MTREVAILETFADQAAIALENARLFREMKEALERQTATSEVLSVISRSPTDVAPVFQAVVDRAARSCEADNATLMRRDGDVGTTGRRSDIVGSSSARHHLRLTGGVETMERIA